MVGKILYALASVVLFVIYGGIAGGLTVGWAWWMWMALHLGSFGMFLFGLVGTPVASVLGLWSLAFGIPHWVLHLLT